MQNTIWHPVLASVGKPKMAEPLIPVSESMGIEHEQHFDALALIQDMSDLALRGGVTATGQARVRCIILLTDGSRNKDTSKVCHLPVTIFADARHDGQPPQLFHQLRKATEGKIATAFYGIQGKKSDTDDTTWFFTSSFGFFIVCASETIKGKQLESKATELIQAEAEAVPLSMLQS